MADWELYAEANRRGILPPEKKALYDEAIRRGLVESPATPQPQVDAPVLRQGTHEPVRPGQIGQTAPSPKMGELEPAPEWGELPGNIPGSGVQFAKDIYQAVRHPVETTKAIGSLASGYAQKLVSEEHRIPEAEQTADAFTNAMVERYGGLENLKRTVIKDPVGFLGDLASAVTGAGGVVRGVGQAGKIPQVVKAGEAITHAGMAAEPVNLALKGAAAPAKLVPQQRIDRAYTGAVKFHSMPTEKLKRVTQTALDNKILPTIRGLEELQSKISDINTQISTVVDTAVDSGKRIPVDNLFKHLNTLEKEILTTSGDPIIGQEVISKIKNDIVEANRQLGRGELTPREAQQMKVKIYKELDKAYEKNNQLPVKADTKMAIARALKEEIETIVPEIKHLNKKDSALIELRKELEKTTRRLTNRDLIGIGVPIKGGAGAGMGYALGPEAATAGAAIGMLLGFFETPGVKSRLSIVLNKLKKQGVDVKPTPTLARLGLMQAGRASDIVEDR